MWATATMAHSPVASDNAYPTVSGLDLKYLSISALIVSGAVIGAEDHWLFDLVTSKTSVTLASVRPFAHRVSRAMVDAEYMVIEKMQIGLGFRKWSYECESDGVESLVIATGQASHLSLYPQSVLANDGSLLLQKAHCAMRN